MKFAAKKSVSMGFLLNQMDSEASPPFGISFGRFHYSSISSVNIN